TYVPGTTKSGSQTVHLTVDAGPAKTLTITASANGQKSKAKLTSANGKPITVAQLGYGCSLPPAPTFCPAKSASSNAHQYKLKFATTHQLGLSLNALVGPTNKPSPPVRTAGGLVVQAYKPTVRLVARNPKVKPSPSHPVLPSTSVTANPGDVLAIIAHNSGTPV